MLIASGSDRMSATSIVVSAIGIGLPRSRGKALRTGQLFRHALDHPLLRAGRVGHADHQPAWVIDQSHLRSELIVSGWGIVPALREEWFILLDYASMLS